jgi:hypothetical protein
VTLTSLVSETLPAAVLTALAAYPDVVHALDGLVEEHDRLGYPPTTRLIYARVVLGRLRGGGYENASPRKAAETLGGGVYSGPENEAGAEHRLNQSTTPR